MTHTELIEQYRTGPAKLRAALAGMTAAQIAARPVPGKWSTLEVLCHIADFEPVYGDRMKRVLAEEQPKLPSGDPDLFQQHLAYGQRDAQEELAVIEAVRNQMARILATLSEAQFARTGLHSADGPLSLRVLLERITGHIPHHLKFIEEKRQALGLPKSS
ncbi:MAG: DinB family protein [Planctomycetes bacterium]|nr:DinB family protein [Planctomycetota bacterium]